MFICKKEQGIKCKAFKDCPECPVRKRSENMYTCQDWLKFYNYVEDLENKVKLNA